MAVNLSPVGGAAAQFFDNSGNVLTGGKLYTYLAGTTTPAVTYTTSSGITAHPNPIVLNAAGRVPDSGEIWLTDNFLYKFVLKDTNDVQIAVWDNIKGINSNFVNYVTQNETASATQGQTVFTLNTIQYTPATNSLAVYVNGSKQILALNYVETSSTVVTFVDGLNVGDVVQFSTAVSTSTNTVDASNVSYDEGGIGAVVTNVQDKLRQYVSVKDFGATGDGTTDDSVAIQAALTSSNNIYFPDGTYVIGTGITKTADNVLIDFGNAVLVNNGPGFLFTFGVLSNTPQNTGLMIKGGHFTQSNPTTTANQNYILIQAIKDFNIKDCILDNVSNGGICVYAGAEAGVIDSVKINGKTGYSTCRGIWLNGSTATDFNAQYVDTNSITRNGTAFPIYAVKNVKIVNCTVIVANYGVYLMNAWDCVIENCHIDASGVGSTRCIAINNYSPRARIANCTLISDRSCTGILITQCSDDVIVADNVFRGSFGGNRAIYVAFLAQALISNNRFSDTTTQHIQVDMGGFANIRSNEFVRASKTNDNRAVFCTAIDNAATGTAIGSTATVPVGSGVVFENNYLSNVAIGVYVNASLAASNGNEPAPQFVQVTGNTFMKMVSLTGSEYPLNLAAGSSGNVINARFERNVVYPYTASQRNQPIYSGTDYIAEVTTVSLASFQITVAAGGGAITSTRIAGNNFICSASRSGADLVLSPRTQLGTSGAAVPIILGITDAGGATLPRTYVVRPSGSNYLVSAYDSAGTQISFATAGISFNVLVGPIGLAT